MVTRSRILLIMASSLELEAVILPIDEYERIQALADLIEHLQIYKAVEKRKATPLEAYVNFEQILAEHGLSSDDL